MSIRLEDEVDLARGELIAAVEDAPTPPASSRRPCAGSATRAARERDRFLLKHGTRTVPARLEAIAGRIEFETLEWPAAEALRLNYIAQVCLRLGGEIAADPYAQSHATGAFILIDEATNDTVAAGMVPSSRSISSAG